MMMIIKIIMIMIRRIIMLITRAPSCQLHDREMVHALPSHRRLRPFGKCSSRLGHLVEPNMMSLHASEFRATAECVPRIFSLSTTTWWACMHRSFEQLPSAFHEYSRFLIFSFSRFLVFSFSRFLVFSFSRFLVCSFSRFLVFSFSRLFVFSFSRVLVFSLSRFLVFS